MEGPVSSAKVTSIARTRGPCRSSGFGRVILERLGYEVTLRIDREIAEYA